MFSVLILTLNEERTLRDCVGSVQECDDVVVLDSGSQDRTAEVARELGCRVVVNPFQNFAQQRNHAHRAVTFRHPWIFHLDADERMTPELQKECRAWQDRDDVDGAYVAPKMLYQGRWLPRCTDFPAYQARFVHAQRFRWVEVGHGQREHPTMRMTHLRASYLHEMMQDGEAAWLDKHRRYAVHEAAHRLTAVHHGERTSLFELFAANSLRRRRALKAWSFRIPARPLARFIYQYLLRQGFRDGPPAYRYCRLLAQYEGFIRDELRRGAP